MAARPVLKLKLNKPGSETPAPSSSPPASGTPNSAAPKIKLKFNPKPPAAAPEPKIQPSKPKKSTPAKTPKVVFKQEPKKKRARENNAQQSSLAAQDDAESHHPRPKRLKLSTKPKPPPQIKINIKGKPRERPPGVGYDSEASDAEVDPALEEEFILRMQPGEDCEYLRKAIEEKRFGPRSQGGADVSFKPLTRDCRRATVTIQGRMYAASLVDLPCIIEGLKSWDKRGWYKTADICQMLLVLGRISSEEEALNYPLPKDIDPTTFQAAHGLTPPMRWVRRRRFRKRVSHRTIEAVELEVARLLKQDEEAVQPPDFEVMDFAQYAREQQGEEEYDGYDEDQDAEGEVDEMYYETEGQTQEDQDALEDALAAEMEAALAAHQEASAQPAAETAEQGPGSATTAAGVVEAGGEAEVELYEAGTPHTKHTTAGETSDEEDEESEESSPEEEADELDEDALEQQRQLQEQREEIAELENLVRAETQRYEQTPNLILRQKLARRLQNLKQELMLKKVSIGEAEE
jgi:transcription initiation factor TFIID subunit 7